MSDDEWEKVNEGQTLEDLKEMELKAAKQGVTEEDEKTLFNVTQGELMRDQLEEIKKE